MTQVAPFLHGLLAHSFTSAKKKRKEVKTLPSLISTRHHDPIDLHRPQFYLFFFKLFCSQTTNGKVRHKQCIMQTTVHLCVASRRENTQTFFQLIYKILYFIWMWDKKKITGYNIICIIPYWQLFPWYPDLQLQW